MQMWEMVKCLVCIWNVAIVCWIVHSFVRLSVRSPIHTATDTHWHLTTPIHAYTMDTISALSFLLALQHTTSAKSITKLLKIKQVFKRWMYKWGWVNERFLSEWTIERTYERANEQASEWICVIMDFWFLQPEWLLLLQRALFLFSQSVSLSLIHSIVPNFSHSIYNIHAMV